MPCERAASSRRGWQVTALRQAVQRLAVEEPGHRVADHRFARPAEQPAHCRVDVDRDPVGADMPVALVRGLQQQRQHVVLLGERTARHLGRFGEARRLGGLPFVGQVGRQQVGGVAPRPHHAVHRRRDHAQHEHQQRGALRQRRLRPGQHPQRDGGRRRRERRRRDGVEGGQHQRAGHHHRQREQHLHWRALPAVAQRGEREGRPRQPVQQHRQAVAPQPACGIARGRTRAPVPGPEPDAQALHRQQRQPPPPEREAGRVARDHHHQRAGDHRARQRRARARALVLAQAFRERGALEFRRLGQHLRRFSVLGPACALPLSGIAWRRSLVRPSPAY